MSLAFNGLVEKPSTCAWEAGYGKPKLDHPPGRNAAWQSTQYSLARRVTLEPVDQFSRMFKGLQAGYALS